MRKALALAALVCGALAAGHADAGNGNPINPGSANTLTLAVFGDWPYGPDVFAAAPRFIDSINGDPKVRLVLHVGDIHSGSQPCTGSGLSPLPAKADPTFNEKIFAFFESFKDPLVYTPGDNEWTDCHKTGQLSSGAPLNELAAVRDLFFPDPGVTLGGRKMRVLSQAEAFDPAHPTDAQFVENVMWEDSQVVFVTLNVPGSNNDGVKWTAPFTNEPARLQEVAERTPADIRWLQQAFALAEANGAAAVLIGLQADMWDPAQVAPGGNGLNGYTGLVHVLADAAVHFGKPVLLINGDSHLFGSDRPLADPASATGQIHGTQAVPNLTRVTVQGSTNTPLEWLRLTIDPRSEAIFSFENVVVCQTLPCE
jgi:hypothetical protein